MGKDSHITGSCTRCKILVYIGVFQQCLGLPGNLVDSYSGIGTYGSCSSSTYTGSYGSILQGLLAISRYNQTFTVFLGRGHIALAAAILGIFLGGDGIICILAQCLDIGARYQCLGISLNGIDSYGGTYAYSGSAPYGHIKAAAIVLQYIGIVGLDSHIIGSLKGAAADFCLNIVAQLVDSHIALNCHSCLGTNSRFSTYPYIEDSSIAICLDRQILHILGAVGNSSLGSALQVIDSYASHGRNICIPTYSHISPGGRIGNLACALGIYSHLSLFRCFGRLVFFLNACLVHGSSAVLVKLGQGYAALNGYTIAASLYSTTYGHVHQSIIIQSLDANRRIDSFSSGVATFILGGLAGFYSGNLCIIYGSLNRLVLTA